MLCFANTQAYWYSVLGCNSGFRRYSEFERELRIQGSISLNQRHVKFLP